jgi:predicted  nucleic acid-binding Zn-ribbon protein
VVATIPEDLVDHYQRIARTRSGLALAEVREETCTQCRVRVRPHVFQALRKAGNTEIFHCESCNRILYFIEPQAAPSQAAQAAAPGGEQ